jgi:sulfur carrier protein
MGQLTMTITLNGETTHIPDNITVLGLLEHLKVQHQRVAVELNTEIVKKDVYGATPVKEGDSLEVVSFMAGGQDLVKVQCSKFNVNRRSFS